MNIWNTMNIKKGIHRGIVKALQYITPRRKQETQRIPILHVRQMTDDEWNERANRKTGGMQN